MKIQVPFSEGSKRAFASLPAGWYVAEIFDVQQSQATTGTDYLNVEFKIQEPPEAKGRSIWDNFYLTQKASWKLEALQNAVGLEPGSELDTDDLIGKRLRIKVKEVEDQEGNLRVEVVAFRRLPAEKVPF